MPETAQVFGYVSAQEYLAISSIELFCLGSSKLHLQGLAQSSPELYIRGIWSQEKVRRAHVNIVPV